MSKPNKQRFSGIMIFANQWPLSRLSSVSFDTDLNEEEIREIGNEEVVERVDQTPTVSISLETNEYADIKNLRYITQVETGPITVNSFDGPTVDVVIATEEDTTFSRSAHINDAVPVSLSYNFDVGGLATESFSLESDNMTWYLNAKKIIRVFNATGTTAAAVLLNPNPWAQANANPEDLDVNITGWTPWKLFVDGQLSLSGTQLLWTNTGDEIYVAYTGGNLPDTGTRYRVLAYCDTTNSAIALSRIKNYDWGVTDTASTVGGISKGMIDVLLTTGTVNPISASFTTNSYLRLQTCSIDVDLSRETLEELGHDRAFEKTLTLPVPVTVTFNALSSDLAEFAKFTLSNFGNDDEMSIAEFGKQANLGIRIYTSKDTVRAVDATPVKWIMVTGMDISSTAFGVDVGSNATQDFTATTSNITISGTDLTAGTL